MTHTPIPPGWRLVPEEPDSRMHDAARDWSYKKYGKPIGTDASLGCWKAMYAAAPQPPAPPTDAPKCHRCGTDQYLVVDDPRSGHLHCERCGAAVPVENDPDAAPHPPAPPRDIARRALGEDG